MPRRTAYDRWLFFTAGLIALGGLLMVGSASSFVAMGSGDSPSAYYLKHLIHLACGFCALVVMLKIPYRRLADGRLMLALLATCVFSLLFVLTMPEVNGARRWIPIGPLTLQPSEFAKLFAILFTAFVLSRNDDRVNDFWKVPAPCFAVIGILALFTVIEPDLGSAVMLGAAPLVMIFVAGLAWRTIGAVGLAGALGIVIAIVAEPFRRERIMSFLNPSADVLDSGFQLQQSLIAIGSGGLTGCGLGQGQQKAFYLPAVHTDFIYAIIGEELGLRGTLTLLVAFLLIFWRGMRAAVRAPDRFGFYLGIGITALLVFQALINMCVCTGLLPTKGLPLPLISYGGSSLVASMAALGLLINISQHSN